MQDYSRLISFLLSYVYLVFLIGFFYYITLCVVIGHIAGQKGHSGWQWGLFAVFFNPLVVLLFLIAAPQRRSLWSTGWDDSSSTLSIQPNTQRRTWEQVSDADNYQP